MSSDITEEASRLRANAASSLIGNELEFNETKRNYVNFKVQSTTSEEIYDKEFKTLLVLRDTIMRLFGQSRLATTAVCSAISASVFPLNSSAKITAVIIELDSADNFIREAESSLTEFNNTSDFFRRRDFIEIAYDRINKAMAAIKNALDHMHTLLFGQ